MLRSKQADTHNLRICRRTECRPVRIRLSETVCRDYPIHPKPDRNYRSPRHRNGLAGPPSTTNRHSGPDFGKRRGPVCHKHNKSTRSGAAAPRLESIQDGRRYHKPDKSIRLPEVCVPRHDYTGHTCMHNRIARTSDRRYSYQSDS